MLPATFRLGVLIVTLGCFFLPSNRSVSRAGDWPQSRYDAGRTAASPEELATKLYPQWSRELPLPQPAWPDQAKITFDWAYDPIVIGRRIIVGSSRQDCVIGLDVDSGDERWRFYTDGPVRAAPAGWDGRVYIGSDDGYLYCLDAEVGTLLWKFRGGPADRRILGNERLISAWPVRGGPVIADKTVYFAASIWPFMGVFVHALDAQTGVVRWTNDGDGSLYMKQPHSTDSFASVAPQGSIAAVGDTLIVPGGRSVPACYDRNTGKLLRYLLNDNNRKGGGSEVAARGTTFCNGEAVFEVATEKYIGVIGKQPVLGKQAIYAIRKDEFIAYGVEPIAPKTSSATSLLKKLPTSKSAFPELTVCKTPPLEALIQAGSRVYAGGSNQVMALKFAAQGDKIATEVPSIVWQASIEGTVVRLVAAAERLFAVTREGELHCFGPEQVKFMRHSLNREPLPKDASAAGLAKKVLATSGVRQGYCVVFGAKNAALLAELHRQSQLRVIGVVSDLVAVQESRQLLAGAGLYGDKIAVHQGDCATVALPPYLASLMVFENADSLFSSGTLDAKTLRRVFESLRPYGGVACLPLSESQGRELVEVVKDWPQAKVRASGGFFLLTRDGALPGSANWTHEHADSSNTRVSKDQIAKAPLGILWFGGASNDAVLPRHGHGPQPQVVDGRMIIEGMDMLRALDIYTGRLLWETKLRGIGAFYNNLAHQPGANSTGTNFISHSDGIYAVLGNHCVRLDPDTGKKTDEFHLPVLPDGKTTARWGYINVEGDFLIGGSDPILDPDIAKATLAAGQMMSTDDKPIDAVLKLRWKTMMFNDNLSASRHLVVMDRRTGKVRWSVSAEHSFRHNATCIGGRRLYTMDRPTASQIDKLKKKDVDVASIKPRLLAFDLETGKELWNSADETFGTWLSYSAKHDVLVESGRNARDTLLDEPKGMRAMNAATGKTLWKNMSYVGPAILHGDTILRDTKGCDLLTGAPTMRPDPITGKPVEWSWSRNYGCNTPAASEHLLTFRSGAAGYFDLCGDGGTGNFGGFRSSCTNNLIVAGGVLTAPDYTRTCTCSYQNQTSVGLVHMPELEMWTMFGSSSSKAPLQQVGINFGAPGDRRAADGTLWLEYPSVGGPSPSLAVVTEPVKVTTFRRHESQVGGELPWVAASGLVGVQSLSIPLGTSEVRSYTVRMIFSEPENLSAGERVFSVSFAGKEVLHDLDVVREAGVPLRSIVKEVKGVIAEDELTITLTPSTVAKNQAPIICGIEIRAESK